MRARVEIGMLGSVPELRPVEALTALASMIYTDSAPKSCVAQRCHASETPAFRNSPGSKLSRGADRDGSTRRQNGCVTRGGFATAQRCERLKLPARASTRCGNSALLKDRHVDWAKARETRCPHGVVGSVQSPDQWLPDIRSGKKGTSGKPV